MEAGQCSLGCVSSILCVGFLWGATNPLLRMASIGKPDSQEDGNRGESSSQGLLDTVTNFVRLFANWRFAIPFLINQLGSVLFNVLLVQFPVSLVVPCVNAMQLISALGVGLVVGEKHQLSTTNVAGVFAIVFGIAGMLSFE